MNTDETTPGLKRIDLSGLRKLSGGDKAMELKYINNFLTSVPIQLKNIETALKQDDGNLLYNTFHLLKAQLQFYGIKDAYDEVRNAETLLQPERKINELIKKSTEFILNEITFACSEFEAVKNHYL